MDDDKILKVCSAPIIFQNPDGTGNERRFLALYASDDVETITISQDEYERVTGQKV